MGVARMDEAPRDHRGQEQQSLEAPTDHHEAPAVVLRHVVVREAGERRERDQQSVERLARIGRARSRRAGSRAAEP